MRKRWDTDERGHGVADARRFEPDVRALAEAIASPDWVAEEPDAHLLPHFREAVGADGSPWRLLGSHEIDGVLELSLVWQGASRRGMRADAVALLGVVAEAVTLIRERRSRTSGEVMFEAVTGMLEGDGAFAPHGHTIRFRVRAAREE